MSYPNADISFPGLFGDWRFTLSPKLLDIGNGIYWYGVLIAAGLLIALWFCMKRAPRYGLTEDDVIDTVLWAIPFAIVGARVYYVLFYLDQFRLADGSIDWAETYRIWDGGLAIYGAVIAAFLTAWLVCRKKQLSLWALADCCVAGFFIGQAIGRWGNFFNREAFGGMTELPWRMRLWISGTYYIDVHPTFLYESLWNVAGLLLLCLAVDKVRRFDGENTCFYFLWYGIGRFWIEGLRTDSLYLFDLTFLGERVRVSQALSLVMIVLTAVILLKNRSADPARMFVNRRLDGRRPSCPIGARSVPSRTIPRRRTARRRRPRRTPPVGKRPQRAPQSRRTAETTAEILLNKRKDRERGPSVLLCCFMVCSARRRAFWPSSAPGGASGRR